MKALARKQRDEGDEVITEAMRRKHYQVMLALEVAGQYVIGLLDSRCHPQTTALVLTRAKFVCTCPLLILLFPPCVPTPVHSARFRRIH